ncbi:MAG: ABC transporter permease [Clostridium sp.]
MKKVMNVLIGITILLLIWQGIVLTGRYEEALLPSPITVFTGTLELIKDGSLFEHIAVSLMRFSIGYFSAIIVAVILGIFLGWVTPIWDIVDPIVQVLRPISPMAWLPFIVLWFGIGDIPAIVIIFIAAFFPVLLSTVSGVKRIDKTYLKVSENFGISGMNLFTKVIFPAAFPSITNGIHMALGAAWIFLVAGEMVGAQSGLGYLVIDSRNSMRTDHLLSAIIFIGIIGLVLDKLLKFVESLIESKWGQRLGEGE